MKPEIDHEAAQKWAEAFDAHIQPGVNLSSCYLDAMAQLDKATELLREYAGVKRAGVGVGLLAKTRLFLNERK